MATKEHVSPPDDWFVNQPNLEPQNAWQGQDIIPEAGGAVTGSSAVSDAAYDATTWNGDTTHAPSKNAIRDKIESLTTTPEIQNWTVVGNVPTSHTTTGVANEVIREDITLTGTPTLTIALSNNQQADLVLHQDGTGSRTVTWSGVDVWATLTGSAPTLATAASAIDRLYFEKINGTTYGYFITEAVAPGNPGLNLVPTAVKTANYTAAAGDLVPCNTSGGAFAVTLPTAPANKTTIGVQLVTAGNTLTISLGGSDVLDKTGGSTSMTINTTNRLVFFQYKSSGAIWYRFDHLPAVITTKGDLLGYSTERVRIPVGTDGDILVSNSAVAAGLGWVTPTALDACRAFLSSAVQSIPNNAHTAVTFDAEDYDDNSIHTTGGNNWEFVVPATGRYRVSTVLEFAFNAVGGRQVTIWLNPTVASLAVSGGTRLSQASCAPFPDNSVGTRPSLTSGQIQLTAGDKIVIAAYQDSTGALNLNTGTGSTWACIERVK